MSKFSIFEASRGQTSCQNVMRFCLNPFPPIFLFGLILFGIRKTSKKKRKNKSRPCEGPNKPVKQRQGDVPELVSQGFLTLFPMLQERFFNGLPYMTVCKNSGPILRRNRTCNEKRLCTRVML